MGPRRRPGALDGREILQVLVVALGWIGFVWLWVLVGRQPWEASRLVWLILGSLIVLPLLTLAWVIHNRAIFRRKGERLGVPAADFSYGRDWHGRRVVADWEVLRLSRFITVGVEGRIKTYWDTALEDPQDAAPVKPATHPRTAAAFS